MRNILYFAMSKSEQITNLSIIYGKNILENDGVVATLFKYINILQSNE